MWIKPTYIKQQLVFLHHWQGLGPFVAKIRSSLQKCCGTDSSKGMVHFLWFTTSRNPNGNALLSQREFNMYIQLNYSY